MMKVAQTAIAVLFVLSYASSVQATIAVETVHVGNPGNLSDTEVGGFGSVDYAYSIGKFEITSGQYVEFLNAVAKADPYSLFVTAMFDNLQGCKIQRTGSTGNFSYNVAADYANRPACYIRYGSALRFANWMHNGQPTGILSSNPALNVGLTEDGSYALNGATTAAALDTVVRNANATWVLPTDSEWYKAAYYDPGSNLYFDYPTSSNIAPSNTLGSPTDPGNSATFRLAGPIDTIGSPYWRTEVGAHENSASPYGTFDQGGNVSEWSEGRVSATARRLWGGNYFNGPNLLLATNPTAGSTGTAPGPTSGFRLALIPEPASVALLALGGLGLFRRRPNSARHA